MSQHLDVDCSPLSHKPSDELVLAALAGNEEAFTTLYNRYTPELGRYLGGLVNQREDREELVIETFVKAWQRLSQLQDPAHFRPWLYRIATNLAHDHHRREKLWHWLHLENYNDIEAPDPFELMIEETELIQLALQEVPWKYRTCLLLHVEGKFLKQEIAETVKISFQSVPSYISYGRERFRKAYRRLTNETREREPL